MAVAFLLGNTLWWLPLILVVGAPALRAALYRFQAALDVIFGAAFVGYGVRILGQEFGG